jgi:hypothetical protein
MAVNRQHTMTPAEQRAMNEAESFRAMSLTDAAAATWCRSSSTRR